MRFFGAGGKFGFSRGSGEQFYDIYSVGNNFYGQLGTTPLTNFNGFDQTLDKVDQGIQIKYLDYSFGTTMLIGSDDHLYFMGNNNYGNSFSEANGGTHTIQRVFTDQQDDGNWKMVSVKNNFALGIKNDGTLWAWGNNNYGQLGQGNTTSLTGGNKAQVGSGTNWTFIEALRNAGAAGISGGELYTWGRNSGGELGLGDTTQRNSPTKVGSFDDWNYVTSNEAATIALRNGRLYSAGQNILYATGQGTNSGNTTTLTQIGSATNWVDVIGVSQYNAFACNQNGELYAWGQNSYFQMGTTSSIPSPTRVLTNRTDFTSLRDEYGRKNRITGDARTSYFLENDGIYSMGYPDDFGFGFLGTTFTKIISEAGFAFLDTEEHFSSNRSLFLMK